MPSIAKLSAQTDNDRADADFLVREFLHALASRRQDVRDFRAEVLEGGLLASAALPGWLRTRSDRPRRGKVVDYLPDWAGGPLIPVRTGGILERLCGFADRLHDDFVGWSRGDAIRFLLTGAVVGAPSLVKDGLERTGHLVFSVNPLLSPRELAEEYARIRRSVFGSRIKRLRRQKLKAIRLALFHAQRLDSETTWKERLLEWNRMHPRDRYDPEEGVPNFWRDTKEAFKRLREQIAAYKQEGGSKK